MALTAIVCLLNISCKKNNDPHLIDAVITGSDARVCACCGGLMLTFNGETHPYTGTFFLIDNNPAELGIGNNESFPLLVKVDTSKSSVTCFNHFVHITKLERR